MGTEIATCYFSLVPSTKGIGSQIEGAVVGPAGAAGTKGGKSLGAGIEKGSKSGILSAKNALTGLGVIGALAAVKSVQGFSTAAKEVMQLKRQVGGTTEEMSRLRFVAQQSGVSTQTMARAFVLLSKSSAAGKLDQFGIAAKNADGSIKPLPQLLGLLADRYKASGDAGEKNRILMAAFGRGGAEMGKILGRGSQGIADLEKEADKLGVTLTDKNLAAVQKNLEATRRFSASVQGLEIQLGQGLLPILTDAASLGTKFTTAFSHQPALLRDMEIGAAAAAVGYSKLLKPIIGLAGKADGALRGIGPIGSAQPAADAGVAAASTAAASAKTASAAASAELAAQDELAAVAANMGLTPATAGVTTAASGSAAAIEAETAALADLSAAETTAATASSGLSLSLGTIAAPLAVLGGLWILNDRGQQQSAKSADQWVASIAKGRDPLSQLNALQGEQNRLLKRQDAQPGLTATAQFQAIARAQKAAGDELLRLGNKKDILAAWASGALVGHSAIEVLTRAVRGFVPEVDAQGNAVDAAGNKLKGWGQDSLGAAAAQAALAANTKTGTQTILERAQAQSQLVGAAATARDAEKAYADDLATAAGRGKVIDDLRKQASQTAISDAASVKSAEDGVTQAYEQRASAIQTLKAAQATLVADGKADVQLVKDMAAAIDEAKKSIVSLRRSAARDKVGVTEAKIAMDEAIAAQKVGPLDPSQPNEQARLDDAATLARLDYADAVDRATASQQASNKANADGVLHSSAVLSVQEQIHQNAIKTQQDRDAEATAVREVAKANDAIGTAAAAAADAVRKSRDDQVTAYGNIRDAEKEAADKADGLKTAASEAALAWATSAEAAGLPVQAILTGLKNLADSSLPAVKTQIDALILELTTSAPISAGAGVHGGGNLPTPTSTSGHSSWGDLADLIKNGKGTKGGGSRDAGSVQQQKEANAFRGVAESTGALRRFFEANAHASEATKAFFLKQAQAHPAAKDKAGVIVQGNLVLQLPSKTARQQADDLANEILSGAPR